MNTAARVGIFLLGLAAVFALALAAGGAMGPVGEAPTAHTDGMGHTDDTAHSDDKGRSDDHIDEAPQPTVADAHIPGGLMVSQDGYTLALDGTTAPAGTDVPLSFTITGPSGSAVTEFETNHDKPLHLIAVRRDLTGFQHVHPTMDHHGTWSTTLDLDPGVWRLFADFQANGADPLTLGADLTVGGDLAPRPLPEPGRVAEVDGYTVTLDGELVPGTDSDLRLSVTKDGRPVTNLQPYLGAFGHLVALRAGDLAYLHVHPSGHPGDGVTDPGPDIAFEAAVPSAGTYRLFLDFKHGGVVRTAAFTVTTGETR